MIGIEKVEMGINKGWKSWGRYDKCFCFGDDFYFFCILLIFDELVCRKMNEINGGRGFYFFGL